MRHLPPGGGSGILFGIVGFFSTLLFLALITALVIFLVQRRKGRHCRPGEPRGWPGHGQAHRPPMPPALQILDERLASGDIEIDDYLNRKAAMLGQPLHPNEWTPPAEPPAPAGEPINEPTLTDSTASDADRTTPPPTTPRSRRKPPASSEG